MVIAGGDVLYSQPYKPSQGLPPGTASLGEKYGAITVIEDLFLEASVQDDGGQMHVSGTQHVGQRGSHLERQNLLGEHIGKVQQQDMLIDKLIFVARDAHRRTGTA